MANRELKQILIPEGLDGERVDLAISRILGLSRSSVAELIEANEI